MENRDRFSIKTPIGYGTAVGITCDRDAICVMHTRPAEEQDKKRGITYIKWWKWDDEKKEITGELEK